MGLPARIAGSNPTRGIDVCLLLSVMCYQVEVSADRQYRGVLPPVMRRCVWSRNLKNEEVMAHVGPQRHLKKKSINIFDFVQRIPTHISAPRKSKQIYSFG